MTSFPTDIHNIIGREKALFTEDIERHGAELYSKVRSSRFLIIGGAGTIGKAVTKEVFSRSPQKLHVVDISENNTVELVRELRSDMGYIEGEFKTFAIDAGSMEFDAFIQSDGEYDYVLNLSALKHVRSEKDPFTLMRMIQVNILNIEKSLQQSIENGSQKYFCVSTDKAANPANLMGASKKIMELFLLLYSARINVSSARFANVAFSDGSLLHGFQNRMRLTQPIVAPHDVKRYFMTPKESGELCLLSCLLGENRDIFFPKLLAQNNLLTFSEIAVRFLESQGYEPYLCNSETEAREKVHDLPQKGQWPCLFVESDTTGEKDVEEFFTDDEKLMLNEYNDVGIIKKDAQIDDRALRHFQLSIETLRTSGAWNKGQIVALFHDVLPEFAYIQRAKDLDSKM